MTGLIVFVVAWSISWSPILFVAELHHRLHWIRLHHTVSDVIDVAIQSCHEDLFLNNTRPLVLCTISTTNFG